ncbi:MAG: SpoIIE family protein phosphatase [Calditrichaeota bacterium]|nr:SpoIIE family protein phosphatase [Calditrichota bacterium]
MRSNLSTRIALFTIVAITSIYFGFYFSDYTTPNLAGVPKISKSEAVEKVHEILDNYGFDYSQYYEFGYFSFDGTGSDYLVSELGAQKYNEIAQNEELPLSFWQFEYYKNVPKNIDEDYMRVRISPSGKFVSFFHSPPDSQKAEFVNAEQAAQIAEQFIESIDDLSLENYSVEDTRHQEKENRSETRLQYEKNVAQTEAKDIIAVSLIGKKVNSVNHYFNEPQEANADSFGGANVLFNIIAIFVYLGLTLLSLVLFLQRYHDGKISVKKAVWAGIGTYFVLVIMAINTWDLWAFGTNIASLGRLYMKFVLLGVQMTITYIFLFTNTFTAWANGDFELQGRQSKYLSGIDSILNRNFITKNIGFEVPIGLAYGAILFGFLQLVNYSMINIFGAQAEVKGNLSYFSNYFPSLTLATSVIYFALFDEIFFRKFLLVYFKNKTRSTFYGLLISAIGYAFVNVFFGNLFEFWPSYYTLIPYFVLGIIQGWIFLQYGLLASITSGSFFITLQGVRFLFASGVSGYMFDGILILSVFVIMLVIGIIGLLKGKSFKYTVEMEPPHIRRIKDRTRMQQELEIAKKVQLGLLPKEQPSLKGYDIAGVCIPALEVGGDYFDFIHLKDGKLGIAIADVSGKGVPAAIYMTLTKGILQSHAESTLSPKTVLSKVNNLMYRTIDRSWYVSMFYAVIDPVSRKLIFSRAGHNPAIVLNQNKKDPQWLQPDGIGLGLEIGEIFTKTLVEGELQLEKGNTLIFYTDGFTEAMNEREEEYGEERFLKFLNENDNGSAKDLVNKAVTEIRNFAGDALQHDDMTMVVLKAF